MKRGGLIVKLVFGLMGVVYTIVGGVCLTVATQWAGDIRRIFTLPDDDLALAIVGTVFTVLGVVFLLVTLGLLLADRKRRRMREELLTWGARVTGTVTGVQINHSIRVNGRSPLVATVRCVLPTGERTIKSRNLWSACPSTGDTVEVLFDPMDDRRYVIEFPGEG